MIDDAFRDEHRISPSQVETAELCERKWAFEKIEGREKPPNKYADRGTAVHDVLELWQSEGIAVDLTTDIGKMVSAGLKFLPQPKSHKTEHPFLFRTSNAVYHGYMDLRGQLWFPIQTVWDHKSTTSFTWMKTPEVLRKDPQAVIYTKAVLEECKLEGRELGKEIQRVELNWVYYLANPDTPRSRKVQLHVMPPDAERLPVCPPDVHKEHFGIMYIDELEERFQEIETLSKRLLNHYHDKPNPMELPYNASACSAYGGCPFRNNPCKLTMSERIQSMATQEEGKKLSMKEKMELRLSNQKNGAAAQADIAFGRTSAGKDSDRPALRRLRGQQVHQGILA